MNLPLYYTAFSSLNFVLLVCSPLPNATKPLKLETKRVVMANAVD